MTTSLVISVPILKVINAIVTAVAVALSLILEFYISTTGYDKAWFDGRAVAESVKTANWRFMMGAKPYEGQDLVSDRFLNELDDILGARPNLGSFLAACPSDAHQISAKMTDIRKSSFEIRKDFYVSHRIQDQRIWYKDKAQENQLAQTKWSRGTMAVQISAIVLAILQINYSLDAFNLIAPLMTVAAVFVGWVQIKRYVSVK